MLNIAAMTEDEYYSNKEVSEKLKVAYLTV